MFPLFRKKLLFLNCGFIIYTFFSNDVQNKSAISPSGVLQPYVGHSRGKAVTAALYS